MLASHHVSTGEDVCHVALSRVEVDVAVFTGDDQLGFSVVVRVLAVDVLA